MWVKWWPGGATPEGCSAAFQPAGIRDHRPRALFPRHLNVDQLHEAACKYICRLLTWILNIPKEYSSIGGIFQLRCSKKRQAAVAVKFDKANACRRILGGGVSAVARLHSVVLRIRIAGEHRGSDAQQVVFCVVR